MRDLRRDLHRDWRKWSRTERFSAALIFAAMITAIVPAAIEFAHQSAIATPHSDVQTVAR
jgi:hypothetical protein